MKKVEKRLRICIGQWMAVGLHTPMKTTQYAAALISPLLPSSCRLGRYHKSVCQCVFDSHSEGQDSHTLLCLVLVFQPPPEDPFLEWLNRICVIIGLFFFALAILTFILCSWNPKINNTARLHLCISLALSHLLLLWNDRYVEHEVQEHSSANTQTHIYGAVWSINEKS